MSVVCGSGSLPGADTLLPAGRHLFSQSTENAQGPSFFFKINSSDFFQGQEPSSVRGTAGCLPPPFALPASLPRPTRDQPSLEEGPPFPNRLVGEQRQRGWVGGRD